jgi:hypothetical protein
VDNGHKKTPRLSSFSGLSGFSGSKGLNRMNELKHAKRIGLKGPDTRWKPNKPDKLKEPDKRYKPDRPEKRDKPDQPDEHFYSIPLDKTQSRTEAGQAPDDP